MEKLDEIRKTLKFYVRSNELKNKIIDEQNNYSVADHLFGSMILATAIDSEFKEADDLAKIYRMLFLSEFSNANPNYNFDNLKLGAEYAKEILEARDMCTKNGRLVFNYKTLDVLLTKLIKEKESILSQSELIKEGSLIISSLCGKNPSECEEIFKFYHLNFRLKDKKRSGWDSTHWNIKSDRIESIAEHVIGTVSLALALNSEFEYNFDTDKELKMLVIHETGETLIGDITPFDGITPEQKKEMEHKAMRDALGNLKAKESLLSLLFEFDDKKTIEAICGHYEDKIEADEQSKLYQDKGMHRSLDDQANNVVFNSKKVQQMLKDGAKESWDIWYEWDKTIYAGDEQFPEFSNMLEVTRANNLLYLDKVVKTRINLTDEEHAFLSERLTDIIEGLYEDDNINSVYLTNYQSPEYSNGVLNITVLLKPGVDYYSYDRIMEDLNSIIAESNKTGVYVAFEVGYEDKYSVIAMNPSEVHCVEELVESTILFDKSGNLSEVKEAMKKYGHLYKFYLVDYVPPVDETISHRLAKI